MLDRRFLAPHAVAQWAQASPSAIASQHVDGRSVTFAALHDSALRWAAALARLVDATVGAVPPTAKIDFNGGAGTVRAIRTVLAR